MKKETENQKISVSAFNRLHSDPSETKPFAEFIEKLSRFSFDTPNVKLRTPNEPKENGAGDSLYVLGSDKVTAHEQHQYDFLDQTTIKSINQIRAELSSRGLLPSQSGDAQTPPIILLTTGDILIQEPERYKPEALEKLENWSIGKIILIANGVNSDSLRIKELRLINKNLIAVSPEGKVYRRGEYLDLEKPLIEAKKDNKIISANPKDATKIELLRAIQEILVRNGFIQKKEQGQETIAVIAPADDRKITAKESITSTHHKADSVSHTYPINLNALTDSPKTTAISLHPESRSLSPIHKKSKAKSLKNMTI